LRDFLRDSVLNEGDEMGGLRCALVHDVLLWWLIEV
jgi:hypothetical protein